MTNNQIINTWEGCYQVSLNSIDEYKRRWRELATWDKPLCPKDNDPNMKWREWACKKIALEGLILDDFPNTVFTSDNKIRLRA